MDPSSILIINDRYIILKHSAQAGQIFNPNGAAILNKPFDSFVVQEDRQKFYRTFRYFDDLTDLSCSLKVAQNNGDIARVHITFLPVGDLLESGPPGRLFCLAIYPQDKNTEYWKNKAFIDEKEYRNTFENIPIGTYKTTSGGRILLANPALLEMLGYASFEELAKRNLEEEGYENQTFTRESFKKMMTAEKKVKGFESAWRRKDGQLIYVRENAKVIGSENGEDIYEGTVEDITEKKSAELRLLESEKRFKALIQNSSDVILLLDAGGKVLFTSPSITRISGYLPEEVLGKEIFEWIHPDEKEIVKDFFKRLLNTHNKPYTKEIRGRHKDGTWLWKEATASNFLSDPNVKAIIVNFRNVTERKQAQSKLEHALARLEKSNIELEKFAYIASHDLQEPLRMISSYMKILEEKYREKLDDKGREYMHYAIDGAKRMTRLIKDLLTYSRVTTQPGQFESVDMKSVFTDVIADLRLLIAETGTVLECKELPVIKGDPVQLRQLLQNLIINAIKFRGERPPEIAFSAEKKGGDWIFSIKDNGIGIETEYFEKIFQLFHRLHEHEKYPGTGIGLAVCRKIVERHGGRIWVKSDTSSGATFFFTIPEAAEPF